jgi:hypothetical protein
VTDTGKPALFYEQVIFIHLNDLNENPVWTGTPSPMPLPFRVLYCCCPLCGLGMQMRGYWAHLPWFCFQTSFSSFCCACLPLAHHSDRGGALSQGHPYRDSHHCHRRGRPSYSTAPPVQRTLSQHEQQKCFLRGPVDGAVESGRSSPAQSREGESAVQSRRTLTGSTLEGSHLPL